MIFVISSKQIVNGEVQVFHHDKDRIRAESFEDAEIELYLQGRIDTHQIEGVLEHEEEVTEEIVNKQKRDTPRE